MLVGDGPEYGRTRELVETLGLAEAVRYVGVVDEVAPLLKAADVLLLPSETESFGLVALEAMASGVPVVASDVGGLPEVVEHGVTGFLAPVGDVDAMAGYCLQLLADCASTRRYSAAARAQAARVRLCRRSFPSTRGSTSRPLGGAPENGGCGAQLTAGLRRR